MADGLQNEAKEKGLYPLSMDTRMVIKVIPLSPLSP